MLFKVILHITIPLGADGVTPEDRANGFTSEWAALPIAMPQARAILLAMRHSGYPGTGMTSDDRFYVDHISPKANGDLEIKSRSCQLWDVSVEFQADWIHYRLHAEFRGLHEQKLLASRTAKFDGRAMEFGGQFRTYVDDDIMVKVMLCSCCVCKHVFCS